MLQPTFAAVVRTPLGLIPLIGNLIINYLFIFCILFFSKQMKLLRRKNEHEKWNKTISSDVFVSFVFKADFNSTYW